MAKQELNHSAAMYQNLQGIFDLRRQSCFSQLNICTPATVAKVDDNGVVYVIPLVKQVLIDKSTRDRRVVRTTLATCQHGGFYQHVPVFVGDTGWLISADRDTTIVKEQNSSIQEESSGIGSEKDSGTRDGNQGPQKPQTIFMHNFSQGFFLPDKWGGVPMPDDLKKSFVIEQVKKNGDSKGRFVMDPDGTIRVFSTRWYDGNEKDITKRLKSGSVFVDLKWFGKSSPMEKLPSWKLGDFEVKANSLLLGDVLIRGWLDPDKHSHGGNLDVSGEGRFGPYLGTNGKLVADGDLKIGGKSEFGKKIVIKEDSRSVVIDPKDLHKSDAKFREVMVVTGVAHDKNDKNKVGLQIQKMRALVDNPVAADPIEFEVGGGGGDIGGGKDVVPVTWYCRRIADKSNAFGFYYILNRAIRVNGSYCRINNVTYDAGSGLYQINEFKSGTGSVYCNIYRTTETHFAILTTQATTISPYEWDSTNKGMLLTSFRVADIGNYGEDGRYDEWSGITQYVAGTMEFSFPLDVSPFSVRMNSSGINISRIYMYAGRTLISSSSSFVINEHSYTGNVYVILDHKYSEGSPTLRMSKTAEENTDDKTCKQIYQFSNGKIINDYRNIPTVPLYE